MFSVKRFYSPNGFDDFLMNTGFEGVKIEVIPSQTMFSALFTFLNWKMKFFLLALLSYPYGVSYKEIVKTYYYKCSIKHP